MNPSSGIGEVIPKMKPLDFLIKRITFLFALLFALTLYGYAQDRAAWMQDAKWGIMNHYLADWISAVEKKEMSVEKWNELINNFDVKGLAKQLESVHAGYYILTIGQNSGYYLSPNQTYDESIGINPSKCSKRDLIADISQELAKYGIKLIVYLPSGAPNGDAIAKKKLEWENGPYPNKEFQLKWEKIITEWSVRWGEKIAGWWFDGCYWPNTMYRSESNPNFTSFAAAARAGNKNSIVAFNPGVVNRTISITPDEDYIAGEISDPTLISIRRVYNGKVDGAQLHILSYLGEAWGRGSPRFKNEHVIEWSLMVRKNEGVITWDVPIQTNGLISQTFMDQLVIISSAINK